MERRSEPPTDNHASGHSLGMSIIRILVQAIVIVCLMAMLGLLFFLITFVAQLALQTPRTVVFSLGMCFLLVVGLLIALIDAIIPF